MNTVLQPVNNILLPRGRKRYFSTVVVQYNNRLMHQSACSEIQVDGRRCRNDYVLFETNLLLKSEVSTM